jgi:DNA-binding NtrC family response regulator
MRAIDATHVPVASGGNSGHLEEMLPLSGTILVVDDDDPVRVMLARLLRTQGYTVLQAAHAAEARAILDTQRPDLVISDIVMPGESGIELRRGILERWPELPVILISGYSAEGPAEFAARTPNTTFVQKPFAADHFLSLVERTLEDTPSEP